MAVRASARNRETGSESKLWGRKKRAQSRRGNKPFRAISATLTALKPSWPSVPAQVKKAHSLD